MHVAQIIKVELTSICGYKVGRVFLVSTGMRIGRMGMGNDSSKNGLKTDRRFSSSIRPDGKI